MKKPNFNKEKCVSTPDAIWFQARPDNCVVVSLSKVRRRSYPWTIVVWGDDDIGMLCYFDTYDDALKTFEGIQNGISRKQLESLGFRMP